MSSQISDRWLWVGFGLLFLVAIKGIRDAITDTVRLTELDQAHHNRKSVNEQEPEGSISVDTLRTLASSPNPTISQAAAGLIVNRFASLPAAAAIIRKDLHSSDEHIKRQACQTVQYLQEWGEDLAAHINDTHLVRGPGIEEDDTYDAVGRGDVQAHAHTSLERGHRSGSMDEIARDIISGQRNIMYVHDADRNVVSRLEELTDIDPPSSSTHETYRPGTASFSGWDTIPSQRPHLGEAEAESRRRRREAMVLHEGEGGFEEEDIIRPRRSGRSSF